MVTTTRIENEFRDCIGDLISFYNRHLLIKNILRRDFMTLFFFKGMLYYYDLAYQITKSENEIRKLDIIKADFDNFRMEKLKNGRSMKKEAYTILVDKELHDLLDEYVRIENAVWERDWSTNGLLAGCIINGLGFYIECDREFFKIRRKSMPAEYAEYKEHEKVIAKIENHIKKVSSPQMVFKNPIQEEG